MKHALLSSALAAVVVLLGAAACETVAGPRGEPVSLTFRVPGSGAANGVGATTRSSGDDPIEIVRGTQRLRLDVLELTFSRIDLQRANDLDDKDTDRDTDRGEDSDRDTDSDQRDNVRFRGSFTVNLPLHGGLITPFTTRIPSGTYDEVKFRIQTAHVVGAFDDNRNGSFEPAESFDVIIPVREKFEVELNPPLVIGQSTDQTNVTVRLNPPRWFRNPDGSVFNPRHLDRDQHLRIRFRHLLRMTIRALEDANRNGDNERDTDSDR